MSAALAKIDNIRHSGSEPSDKEMGKQITEEFHAATRGMVHVLRVGAMVMRVREHLFQLGKGQSGNGVKGGGIKGWMAEYAPDVQLPTAYRFEDVAKAVVKAYQLPDRITKRLTFDQIVLTPEDELDPAARGAQKGLFGFVQGTSQKSLLDNFREASNRGGDTSGSNKKLTPEQEHKQFLENSKNDFINALEAVDELHEKHVWKAPSISDAMLSDSADLLADMAKQMRAWLKIPRRERTKLDASRNGSSE